MKVMGSNQGYILKSFLLYSNNFLSPLFLLHIEFEKCKFLDSACWKSFCASILQSRTKLWHCSFETWWTLGIQWICRGTFSQIISNLQLTAKISEFNHETFIIAHRPFGKSWCSRKYVRWVFWSRLVASRSACHTSKVWISSHWYRTMSRASWWWRPGKF